MENLHLQGRQLCQNCFYLPSVKDLLFGAFFVLLEQTPIQKGIGVHKPKQEVTKVVSLVYIAKKKLPIVFSPLTNTNPRDKRAEI